MRIAVAGTGVIGASWAAPFLRHGHAVVASDPAPGAEERLRAGLPDGADLTFTADPGEAAAGADFVQESGPEREDVKHALIGALDAAARPDVVIASSSSGLLPSDVARGAARHPDRVLVGHPFHPPHLGSPTERWWRDLRPVTLTPELNARSSPAWTR